MRLLVVHDDVALDSAWPERWHNFGLIGRSRAYRISGSSRPGQYSTASDGRYVRTNSEASVCPLSRTGIRDMAKNRRRAELGFRYVAFVSKHLAVMSKQQRGARHNSSRKGILWRSTVATAGKVIAVIDDDEAVLEALERLLSSLGFQTELYGSAEAFVAAAMRSEAACLIVDIQLGDITGIELGRHLSAIGLTFPIIFMTGSNDGTAYNQAIEFGCVAYLKKPFPAEQLKAAIIEAIG